jgi:hypothetical protein
VGLRVVVGVLPQGRLPPGAAGGAQAVREHRAGDLVRGDRGHAPQSPTLRRFGASPLRRSGAPALRRSGAPAGNRTVTPAWWSWFPRTATTGTRWAWPGTARGPRLPRWAAAGGIRLKLYASSLGYVMGTVFLLSWLAQSVTGVAAYDEQRLRQLQAPMSRPEYVLSADFWSRSLQNWQSEFLAIASMAILSVHLRRRGSPESKPVGAAHSATGVEG